MTQVSAHPKHFLSDKVEHFTESVIREMTRQAMQYDAVNLAQGFPDFSAPAEIKRAAQEAIAADVNQYTGGWKSCGRGKRDRERLRLRRRRGKARLYGPQK
jgi:predicted metal-dependent peptidase